MSDVEKQEFAARPSPEHRPEQPVPASRMRQAVTFAGVLIPFAGFVLAIGLLWGRGLTWVELWLLLGMYLAAGLGVTVGYHRLFAHRSFETVRPVRMILTVLGSMAAQGPVLRWVATHRRHHQHSDQLEDPHSPNQFGGSARGVLAGFWHAHVAWIFKPEPPNLRRYVRDLEADPVVRITSRLFGVWVLLGLLIPTVLGGVLSGTWWGAFLGLLWGGLVRIFLGHHVTWSINSICHLWGRRPYNSPDKSRNNFVFGILGMGEGWHNNHHTFPSSARHGLRWWQFDLSYLTIRVMEWVGLARRVRVPARERVRTEYAPKADPTRRHRRWSQSG